MSRRVTRSPWQWARRYAEKQTRRVVGLMSGTSVDGVDAALVRIRGTGRGTEATPEAFVTIPFEPGLREQVLVLSNGGEGNAEFLSRLNFALGGFFAEAAREVMKRSGLEAADLDLIASHGQTVSHTPAPGSGGATLQIGEAAVLAERLGVPVVSDFRVADVAAGGQGAPLAPYADWCLLTHPTKIRAIQNLGGIGNVTYLPADARPNAVLGFDTGPGNMLIDRATVWATDGSASFDRDGILAANHGRIHDLLLRWLMRHPFLQDPPPKSAGREQFGEAFWRNAAAQVAAGNAGSDPACSPFDVVATMTAFTAASIADTYGRFLPRPPDEVIVGGGGARNPTLMAMLRERLAPLPVLTQEDVGIDSDAKEAIAFTVLANETMLGNASNLPSVTGAARSVVLGKLTLP